jgi:hypothetical protein
MINKMPTIEQKEIQQAVSKVFVKVSIPEPNPEIWETIKSLVKRAQDDSIIDKIFKVGGENLPDTLLCMAVMFEDFTFAKYLIEVRGADVNRRAYRNRRSPLLCSVIVYPSTFAPYLISRGAKIDNGVFARVLVVSMTYNSEYKSSSDSDSYEADANFEHFVALINTMLDSGIDVNAQLKSTLCKSDFIDRSLPELIGRPERALTIVCSWKGDIRLAQLLLDRGAELEGVNDRNQTALQRAMFDYQSPSEICEFLISKGATSWRVDEKRALSYAARRGFNRLFKRLVFEGIDFAKLNMRQFEHGYKWYLMEESSRRCLLAMLSIIHVPRLRKRSTLRNITSQDFFRQLFLMLVPLHLDETFSSSSLL